MKLIPDFFNIVAKELDKKYFPDVKYYRENDKCAKVHYTLELFSNGVIGYGKLIKDLSINCNDTNANIHAIVKNFVVEFEGFIYSHNS